MNVDTILISLKDKEFYSLRDVGSTYLTVVALYEQLAELSVLIHSHSIWWFRVTIFFYGT